MVADYEALLHDEVLTDVGTSMVQGYPRFAASLWDLVAHGIAAALVGKEELPVRSQLPEVAVHKGGDLPYVRTR